MDEARLRAALDRAGVPEADYIINSRSGPPLRRGGDHYYLDPRGDGGWQVGLHERGQDRPLRDFASHRAALRFLYTRLTPRGPGPEPGVAQRLAEISADQAEIQRRAWEQFEHADDPGAGPGDDPDNDQGAGRRPG